MTNDTPRVRLKPIALPSEHGSWGFLFEPILLGVLVAPSLGGAAIAAAVVAVFLLRNPLRIFLRARARPTPSSRSRRSPRLVAARSVALAYVAAAAAAAAAGVAQVGVAPFWPLLAVSPLGAVYLFYDSQNRGRSASAEFLGPVVLAASAPAITLAAGWTTAAALATWAIVVLKALPTVIYVRTRLRLEDGEAVGAWPTVTSHAAAVAIGAAMLSRSFAPGLTVAVLAVLAVRAAVGLSRLRRFHAPKQIGIMEFVYSGLYVIATSVGYWALS